MANAVQELFLTKLEYHQNLHGYTQNAAFAFFKALKAKLIGGKAQLLNPLHDDWQPVTDIRDLTKFDGNVLHFGVQLVIEKNGQQIGTVTLPVRIEYPEMKQFLILFGLESPGTTTDSPDSAAIIDKAVEAMLAIVKKWVPAGEPPFDLKFPDSLLDSGRYGIRHILHLAHVVFRPRPAHRAGLLAFSRWVKPSLKSNG
ncbi:hypothetical protein [Paraburkholderia sp. BCC1884]|uniref:hypothetical protein n=1 Tax=Paraburkholderia sp. BCC1884 TaxID=2562668 RepID=UPI001184124F|nr:hypothetical protein [Paraburkholderia sp. BCC1884]